MPALIDASSPTALTQLDASSPTALTQLDASSPTALTQLDSALLPEQTFRLHAMLYALQQNPNASSARIDRMEHHILWRVMTVGEVHARRVLWNRLGALHRVQPAPTAGNPSAHSPVRPSAASNPAHPLSPHSTPFPGYADFH